VKSDEFVNGADWALRLLGPTMSVFFVLIPEDISRRPMAAKFGVVGVALLLFIFFLDSVWRRRLLRTIRSSTDLVATALENPAALTNIKNVPRRPLTALIADLQAVDYDARSQIIFGRRKKP
jgi:hypothetical protein